MLARLGWHWLSTNCAAICLLGLGTAERREWCYIFRHKFNNLLQKVANAMNTFKTLTHVYTYPIPCKNPAMPNFKWSNASTPFTYQFNEVKYCSLINFKCGSEDVWNGGWKWNDDNKNDNTSLPSKMVRHVSHSWVYSSILLRAKRAEIFWHLFYPETNIFGWWTTPTKGRVCDPRRGGDRGPVAPSFSMPLCENVDVLEI